MQVESVPPDEIDIRNSAEPGSVSAAPAWKPLLQRFWKIIAGIISLAGFMLAYISYSEHHPAFDLTGDWLVEDTVQLTAYHSFQGMKLGFRVSLAQQGEELTGLGEKWSENGKRLPTNLHTTIKLTKGTIRGKNVTVTFEEQGAKRTTSGTLYWTYDPTEKRLVGTFSTTSGDTRGSTVATRLVQ